MPNFLTVVCLSTVLRMLSRFYIFVFISKTFLKFVPRFFACGSSSRSSLGSHSASFTFLSISIRFLSIIVFGPFRTFYRVSKQVSAGGPGAISPVPRNRMLRLIPHRVHLLGLQVPLYEPTYCGLIPRFYF